MEEIESLERATLAAVPPQALEELPGWLVGLDRGPVGRARSAVPLRHEAPPPEMAERIAAVFRGHGLPPVFRLPRDVRFEALQREVEALGLARTLPTWVQTVPVPALAAFSSPEAVELSPRPDADWAGLFLGKEFGRPEGAQRLAVLSRSASSLYAAIRVEGEVAAIGMGCFSHGWVGIHGMNTRPAWRGRGFAGRILAAFGQEAQRRGIARAFLQVEEANTGAQALYRRAGFVPAWAYEYWQ